MLCLARLSFYITASGSAAWQYAWPLSASRKASGPYRPCQNRNYSNRRFGQRLQCPHYVFTGHSSGLILGVEFQRTVERGKRLMVLTLRPL